MASQIISSQFEEWKTRHGGGTGRGGERTKSPFQWVALPVGFVKLNVDGCRSVAGRIVAGGVIRDADSGLIRGFSSAIGSGSVLEAEMWALLLGFSLAKELGFVKVLVEFDSMEAIGLMLGKKEGHALARIMKEFVAIREAMKNVTIRHVYREQNKMANQLAK